MSVSIDFFLLVYSINSTQFYEIPWNMKPAVPKKKHDLQRSEPAKLGASDRFVPGFFELRSKNIGQEQRGEGELESKISQTGEKLLEECPRRNSRLSLNYRPSL